MNWQLILNQIESATSAEFKLQSVRPLAGGDINSAYCLNGINRSYFVKLNRPDQSDMFAAEAKGLAELAASKTVRIPTPIIHGKTREHAFLVLEYIDFGSASTASERKFGRQLALLHEQRQPFFGWHRDNTIGSTPSLIRNQLTGSAFGAANACNISSIWRQAKVTEAIYKPAARSYATNLLHFSTVINRSFPYCTAICGAVTRLPISREIR